VPNSTAPGCSVAASRKSIVEGKSGASKTCAEEVATVSGAVSTKNEAGEVTQAVCIKAEAADSEVTYAETGGADAGSIGGLTIALEEW